MLGDQIYEGKGKTVGVRVLPHGRTERTTMAQGTMKGEEYSNTTTGEGEFRPDGTIYVEFRGFFVTKGGVMGRYAGAVNGTRRQDGSINYRGAALFANPPGKYAYLNGIAVIVEVDQDKDGNQTEKGWEWK